MEEKIQEIKEFLATSPPIFKRGSDKIVYEYPGNKMLKLAIGKQRMKPDDCPEQFEKLFEPFEEIYCEEGFFTDEFYTLWQYAQIQQRLTPNNYQEKIATGKFKTQTMNAGLILSIIENYGLEYAEEFHDYMRNKHFVGSANWAWNEQGQPKIFDYDGIITK